MMREGQRGGARMAEPSSAAAAAAAREDASGGEDPDRMHHARRPKPRNKKLTEEQRLAREQELLSRVGQNDELKQKHDAILAEKEKRREKMDRERQKVQERAEAVLRSTGSALGHCPRCWPLTQPV